MDGTLVQIKMLVGKGDVRISEHGYDELADDGLSAREILATVANAELLEEYPDFPKGPSVLVLGRLQDGRPVHAVWGIPKGNVGPAVLVTAYRPDSERWSADFRMRKK